jgi:hypothetical protein
MSKPGKGIAKRGGYTGSKPAQEPKRPASHGASSPSPSSSGEASAQPTGSKGNSGR